MSTNGHLTIQAEPYEYTFDPSTTALLIIDMQRDFLEPGGFGEMLGNDVSQLRRTIEPNKRLLAAWRAAGPRPLAIPVPWAAFSCVASQGTTSFPNSIRYSAKR